MANRLNNNNNSMTSTPFLNWREFFSNEANRPEYGTFDHFDDVAVKYVGSAKEFKTQVKENDLETIIIFPGTEGTIRLFHNCNVSDKSNKLLGIYGMTKYSAAKEVSINALTKAMAPLTASTRSADGLMIPSEEDFKECTSGKDFCDLVGTSEIPIFDISKKPQSFWIHPHVVSAYVSDRQVKISDVADIFATVLEEMEDEHASDLTKQYYEFLVFLWSVSKGFVSWNSKLTDPDEKEAEELLERSSKNLHSGNAPNTGAEDTRGNGTQGNVGDGNDGSEGNRKENRTSGEIDQRQRRESPDRTKRGRNPSPRRGKGHRERDGSQSRSLSRRRQGRDQRDSKSLSRSASRDRPRGRRSSRSRSPPPRARRESQSRSPPHREHRIDNNDLLHQLTRSVSTLAYAQNEKLKKESAEKSALGKLSERQKDLFLLLSARDWHERHPRINRSVETLLQSRQPEKQWNLVLDWSRRWPGLVSKQGLIQFLLTGYSSRNLSGGFTVFMFSPFKKMA
jgi:hypothetical protein